MYFTKNIGFTFSPFSDESIEITHNEWESLVLGQSEGKIITALDGDKPFLSEPPELTYEEEILIAKRHQQHLRKMAELAITPLLDAVDFDIATEKEENHLRAWKLYRIAVNRVDVSHASDINWPESPA
ncbi:tail fiber assembly protein [Acerihabitans sp. TG2]|uniref:tail fiber assembly protein n=1 Tax=Acerihabitans sp. TG2 TaxID=3096008 RepID=UPI002B239565|nr:tail fiber assembly protein [Acerihabitans sp. TG2]MEA9393478.1 tail fiber assembly protein [Acerihabitans sp. TG2]